MRWGPGPILVYEWQRSARRWQMYAGRVLFLSMLLAALAFVWHTKDVGRIPLRSSQMAEVGASFYYAVMGTLLSLVMMIAPAAMAGALCIDKSRGILLPLLATELSDTEIVLGKLTARLAPILGLIAGSMPVLFLCSFLGGIQPNVLVGGYAVALGVAVLSGALALLLSVWGSRLYEVMLATYALLLIALLIVPVWSALGQVFPAARAIPRGWLTANPYWLAFAPYLSPTGFRPNEPWWFLLNCTVLAAAFILATILHMRAVAMSQAGADGRPRGSLNARRHVRWEREWYNDWPMLWLEWCRRQQSRWVHVLWHLYIVVASTLSVFIILYDFYDFHHGRGQFAGLVCGGQVAFGLLLVSVMSVSVLAEERARGSLDILLTTPLSTREIVQGKWWGTYRTVLLVAIWPGVTATLMATRHGLFLHAAGVVLLILTSGAAITSFGLALATTIESFSRAIVLSVASYALISAVGAFAWMVAMFPSALPFTLASPWVGVAWTITVIQENIRPSELCLFADLLWSILYALSAYHLYGAVLRSFPRGATRRHNTRSFVPRLIEAFGSKRTSNRRTGNQGRHSY